jgi:hypothetical protein
MAYVFRLQRHYSQWTQVQRGRLVEDVPASPETLTLAQLVSAVYEYEINVDRITGYPGERRAEAIKAIADRVGIAEERLRHVWKWWTEAGQKVLEA